MINIMHIKSGTKVYGGEKVILNLSKKLNKSKFNNIIIANQNQKNIENQFIKEAKKQGLKTEIIYTIPRFNPFSILKLIKLAKKNKIDIIHTHGYKENLIGFCISKILKVPIITTKHGKHPENLEYKIKEYIDNRVLNYFDKIICVSNELNYSIKNKIKSNKCKTIINGIDSDEYLKQAKRTFVSKRGYTIGIIGRLEIHKDHKTFLKAAKIINKKIPKTKFLIVGDGSLRKELEIFSSKIGLSKKIIFVGFKKNINAILNTIDVLILSSLGEGTPIILLEALVMKKPVIATPVGGIPDMIKNKKTGLLVPIKNPEKLAEAVEFILNNPKKAKEMAENGRKLIEQKFSAKRMTKEYKKVYEELIKNGSKKK